MGIWNNLARKGPIIRQHPGRVGRFDPFPYPPLVQGGEKPHPGRVWWRFAHDPVPENPGSEPTKYPRTGTAISLHY
ncbi:hypothetical protein DC28_10870 [Spirochaeta lutea]|uniref:Uncharacterized protein n=1 Tax=Spirochaeta lutea TaxID=1480694 RepID=A0A098QVY4_9SPIO|nr:hypothetical protein DC28_10870 [Spirochaeta lutea]